MQWNYGISKKSSQDFCWIKNKHWRGYIKIKNNLKNDYLGSFKITMVDLTLAWCKGASFAEICKMS